MSRNRPPGTSALQRRYNLSPFLAARNMSEHAQGCFDVSMEWPLQPETTVGNTVSGTGVQFVFPIIEPRTGQHCIVTRLTFLPRSIAAGDNMTVFLDSRSTQVIVSQINLGAFPGRTFGFPVVNGTFIDSAANGGALQGIRHIYVPEGWILNGAYVGDPVNPSELTWEAEFFFLPNSQPMTTLFLL